MSVPRHGTQRHAGLLIRLWAAVLLVLAIAALPTPQSRDIAQNAQHLAAIGTPVLIAQDRALTARDDKGAQRAGPTTATVPPPCFAGDNRTARPLTMAPDSAPRADPIAIALPRARGPPATA